MSRRLANAERAAIVELRGQGLTHDAIAARVGRPRRTVQLVLEAAGLTNLPKPSESERFWSKVGLEGDCWTWQACLRKGYGHFRGAGGVLWLAHRYAYEAMVGPIPGGLVLDHLCANPPCVNPEHLDPVPPRINTLRAPAALAAICAARTECINGHPYKPGSFHLAKTSTRVCLECRRDAQRRRYARRVGAA